MHKVIPIKQEGDFDTKKWRLKREVISKFFYFLFPFFQQFLADQFTKRIKKIDLTQLNQNKLKI